MEFQNHNMWGLLPNQSWPETFTTLSAYIRKIKSGREHSHLCSSFKKLRSKGRAGEFKIKKSPK